MPKYLGGGGGIQRLFSNIKNLLTWNNIQDKPSTFSPKYHTHDTDDILNIETFVQNIIDNSSSSSSATSFSVVYADNGFAAGDPDSTGDSIYMNILPNVTANSFTIYYLKIKNSNTFAPRTFGIKTSSKNSSYIVYDSVTNSCGKYANNSVVVSSSTLDGGSEKWFMFLIYCME